MALIYTYKEKTSLTGTELFVGTDMDQYKKPNASIKLSSMREYIADTSFEGASPFIPVFDADTTKLSNSIIQQNTNNPVDGISIGGAIDAVTNITATGDVTAVNGVYSNNMSITGNITAGGGTSVVNGARGAAFGNNNQVAGDDAIAAGHGNHSLGHDSASFGHGSSAAGHGSISAGWYASAGNEGTAIYTSSGTGSTFTVEQLVGTATTGMYVYPFNITERRLITNVVDNGDGTYDITIDGGGVQYYEDARVFFESASPARGDQNGTVAIGHNAVSLGFASVAIGRDAQANGTNVVALGGSNTQVQVGNDLTVADALTVNGAATFNGNSFAEITSGTWTPALGTNPGGSIVYTYTTQTGNWYAVGDMVIAQFQIQGFASGVSGSSIVTISMPHDPAFDEPGGTIYDAGTGFSVKPIGFGRSFSTSDAGASILGVNGEILTAADINFSQTFNLLGQLIYKK